MYLPLTDVLACPRCGPGYGLVLLADQIVDRRVLAGTFGCPRCGGRWQVVDGFLDLGVSAESAEEGDEEAAETGGEATSPLEPAEDREPAIRLAALMGLVEGISYALVIGPGVVHAPALSALVEGLEVIAWSPAARGWEEAAGVSRLTGGSALPFHDRSIGGVALTGGDADVPLEEAARVLAPAGRLLLDPAPREARRRLEELGLAVLAEEGEVIVAARR